MENFSTYLGDISLYTYRWPSSTENKRGIIQLVHGVSEYMGRYDEFARFLSDYGFEVWGHDHPGHGQTSGERGTCPGDAMSTLLGGISIIREKIKEENPDLPVILFGHSMGSFLALRSAQIYPDEYAGLVLCGTTGKYDPVTKTLAQGFINMASRMGGNAVLHNALFKMYNANFRNPRTKFDWINSIPEEVDRYAEDPDCGFAMDNEFIKSLFSGMNGYLDDREIDKVRKDLPVFIIGGSMDALSKKGQGLITLAKQFEKAGVRDVYLRIYEGSRHEILNDISRMDVYNDVLRFIEEKTSVKEQ